MCCEELKLGILVTVTLENETRRSSSWYVS